jgi:AcrR family transcriptional regulator
MPTKPPPKDRTRKALPRGRPARTPEDIEATRAHIAACALRVFQQEGYAAVSIRRVAQEADCTPMTVYQYFDRKIDILRHLWAQIFGELFDQLEPMTRKDRAPLAALNAIALAYVAYWMDRRDHYYLVFMSSDVTQSDVSIFVHDDAVVARFQIFGAALSRALPGKTTKADLKVKSELLLCALNGIAHNLITISAYPWSDAKRLVQAAVKGVVAS